MAVAENWEDLLDEIEEPAPVASPAKPAASSNKPKAASKAFAEITEVCDDPVADRLRRQRLVEENEKRLMDDLFAGCEAPKDPGSTVDDVGQRAIIAAQAARALAAATNDPLDAIQLKTFRDCERLVESLSKKILNSPAKSPAWLRLLDLLLKECSPKMTVKDLRTLQGKVNLTITEKETAERQLVGKKKKPNDIGSQCRNYKDELDLVYGDDSEGEDGEDDDQCGDEEGFI